MQNSGQGHCLCSSSTFIVEIKIQTEDTDINFETHFQEFQLVSTYLQVCERALVA